MMRHQGLAQLYVTFHRRRRTPVRAWRDNAPQGNCIFLFLASVGPSKHQLSTLTSHRRAPQRVQVDALGHA